MTYFRNRSNLYYPLVKYSKAKDEAVLMDPHTGEDFVLKAVALTLKLGQYRIVKRAQ